MARIFIVDYSLYGHAHSVAEAVAEGARSVVGAKIITRRVPETLPPDVLAKMGATEIQ